MCRYGSRNPSILLILLVCLLLFLCVTVQGFRRTTRRTTTRRTTTQRTRRTSSTPKITANTPLPVKSYTSSILKSQAVNPTYQHSFRTRFLTGAVSGVLVYSYLYSVNRAYSGVYTPYETSNLLIPQKRALRIAREEYRVQTAEGIDCIGGTLREEYATLIKNVTTKIVYQTSKNFETTVSSPSVTNVNLTDEKTVESFPVNIETHAEYERSLMIESSYVNCTEIVCNVEGHMIRMYDTNPNYNYNLAVRLAFKWYSVSLLLLSCLFATYI